MPDLIWILATLAAYFVKGMCGFANTLVFTSILNFSTANALIAPVELLLSAPTSAVIAWRERKALNIRAMLLMSGVALVVTSIAGM